jgi:hypothetical protein
MLGVLLKLIISGILIQTGVLTQNKFVNAFDDRYFKANPSEIPCFICRLITCGNFTLSHSNQEFYNGSTGVDKSKKRFDFEAEIPKYYKSSELEHNRLSARIKKMEL